MITMKFNTRRQLGQLVGLVLLVCCFASGDVGGSALADAGSIVIDGASPGRTFDGLGALSAGASSRLLVDYPKKQRDQILDYLFKPNYGAGLQINKVEIGSDANSTDGAEPSHMRSPSDQNYSRGYEWWLMAESKKRNPAEKLYILEWGAPGWINPGVNSVWTEANYGYIINFLNHAKSDYGLTVDYVGGWNERGYDKGWYEGFRKALNDSGSSGVKVVGDDSFNWAVGADMAGDTALDSSIDIIGQHYPDSSPSVLKDPKFQANLKTGKPIWFSEMGSKDFDSGAENLAKNFNQSYIDNRATANINWSTIWSVYGGLPYYGCGLMLANEPWNGHYQVGKSIWACAQTTQFAQPGWQYLDGACGFLGGKAGSGSYVALKSPNGSDYSVIIETVDAQTPQSETFKIAGGLSVGPVQVWATNLKSNDSKSWFVKQKDIEPVNGLYSLTVQPDFVYSLTTTTGQAKGTAISPKSTILAMPFRENFSKYSAGTTPKYFSDMMGAFEVAQAGGGRSGNCLRQVVTTAPILWSGPGDPSTVVGDPRWKNYTVSSDVMLEQAGYVDLIGRADIRAAQGNSNNIDGYHLRLSDTGAWSLIRKIDMNDTVLVSGTVPCSVNTWHSLKLTFSGMQITALIDGVVVAKDFFGSDDETGLAGYEVSKWQNAEFQNFEVDAAPQVREPHVIKPITAEASSENAGNSASNAIDGNMATMWHTKYAPGQDALPQSITLNYDSPKLIDTLFYYPRTDGNPNGTITQYEVDASEDGVSFSKAASGNWADDSTMKVVHFHAVKARKIRLIAQQGHGGFASAAEVDALLMPGVTQHK
jgi:hypothetical protein